MLAGFSAQSPSDQGIDAEVDRSRIETHIKALLGGRLVSGLTLREIEAMQADIAAGKSARGRKAGRGGKSTGGSGVASRTVGTLRSLLVGRRTLRRCCAGSRPSLCEGEPQGRDTSRSAPHLCQRCR